MVYKRYGTLDPAQLLPVPYTDCCSIADRDNAHMASLWL